MVRSVTGGPSVAAEAKAHARARLLLVGDFSASRAGNASVAEELARRLAEAGDSVTTTSARSHRLLRVGDMLVTSLMVRNRVDVAVIDVYSGAAFRWAEWVTSILAGAGVSLVHVLRGGNLPVFAQSNPARVGRLMARSNAVVALSGYLLEQLSSYGEIAEMIPNPIELNRYHYRPRHSAEPRLTWLRSFHTIYNPTMAPRVLAELNALLSPLQPQLTMMGADKGDGTLQAVKETAEQLDVSQQLSLPGPVPKASVAARLDEADVFINTADVDNVPISVIEALASGLCVVSTEVGGIPYLLQDGVDALLVPRDDAPAMAAAVARIVTEPDLAERLSRNGRAKAETFDWSRVLPRWRTLIGKVASRPGGTA